MSKYIAGPWKLRHVSYFDIRIAPEMEREHVSIAGMAVWGDANRDEMLANARLIAAAPELAECLREALTWLIAASSPRDNHLSAKSAVTHLRKFMAVLDKAGIDHRIRLQGLEEIESEIAAIAKAEGAL